MVEVYCCLDLVVLFRLTVEQRGFFDSSGHNAATWTMASHEAVFVSKECSTSLKLHFHRARTNSEARAHGFVASKVAIEEQVRMSICWRMTN
jgi:hypothetical protein